MDNTQWWPVGCVIGIGIETADMLVQATGARIEDWPHGVEGPPVPGPVASRTTGRPFLRMSGKSWANPIRLITRDNCLYRA